MPVDCDDYHNWNHKSAVVTNLGEALAKLPREAWSQIRLSIDGDVPGD